jgi:hypothetical protein
VPGAGAARPAPAHPAQGAAPTPAAALQSRHRRRRRRRIRSPVASLDGPARKSHARGTSFYSGRAAVSDYTGRPSAAHAARKSIERTVRASMEGGGLAGKYIHISLLHRGR